MKHEIQYTAILSTSEAIGQELIMCGKHFTDIQTNSEDTIKLRNRLVITDLEKFEKSNKFLNINLPKNLKQ